MEKVEYIVFTHFVINTVFPVDCLWNYNLFENCHLTFIYWRNNVELNNIHKAFPYFHGILQSNPYSPIILNEFYTSEGKYNFLGYDNSPLGTHASSRGTPVTFLHLQAATFKKKLASYDIYVYMQAAAVRHTNAAYLFQHNDKPESRINYRMYPNPNYIGTAVLILFNFNLPQHMFVPCIVCGPLPEKLLSNTSDFTLLKLRSLWFALNNNFHRKILTTTRPVQGHQCDAREVKVTSLMFFDRCRIIIVAKALNFSVVHRKSGVVKGEVFYISHGDTLEYRVNSGQVREIAHDHFEFVFVTPFPTAYDGLSVFLSPFDYDVWTVLLTFCVIITLVITISRQDKDKIRFAELIWDFINATCILLRQGGGNTFTIFYNKKWVAVPILIVWFLGGCYIIMDNLYTGSIFSFMSAILPPKFPSTLLDLVDSEFPIITGDYVTLYDKTVKRVTPHLKSRLIPLYINLFRHMPHISRMFQQLNDKLVFMSIYKNSGSFKTFLSKIEQSEKLNYLNGSIETRKTFVVMDKAEYLGYLHKFITWNGSRLIIGGKEATPFNAIKVLATQTNYVLPIFMKRMRTLSSFGLEDRWNKLGKLYSPLRFQYKMNTLTYKKYFAMALSNGRGPVTFHESDPVSLKSVKEMFVLCVLCVGVAILNVGVECRYSILFYLRKMYRRVTRILVSVRTKIGVVIRKTCELFSQLFPYMGC